MRRLNADAATTDSRTEQSPEGGAMARGAHAAMCEQRDTANDERAPGVDEAQRLCGRENP